mgnify:FL=1
MVKSLGKETHYMLIYFVICSLSTTVRPEMFFFFLTLMGITGLPRRAKLFLAMQNMPVVTTMPIETKRLKIKDWN